MSVAAPVAAQDMPDKAVAPAKQNRAVTDSGAPADTLEAGKVPVPPPPAEPPLQPQVDPIIPDDEFNAAVPPLDAANDAELNKPLESIDAFERRLAGEQSGANPETAEAVPLGDPALADGDAVEAVGDAPVRDTELAAPLPPLEQFEVAPVQFADDAPRDEKDVEVRYHLDLQGLDLADKETDADLKGEFKSLSALEKGDGKAANTAMVSARLTEDSQLMETVLASQGWYSPVVRTRLEPPVDQAKPALGAVIAVTPGKRYVFSDIILKADPTEPANLVADNFALKVGEPIVAERVQGAEAQIAVALPENGYPFAAVGERDILLDQVTGEGAYTLPVTVGPRGRFGGFVTDGDLAFDAKHIQVLSRFKRGQIYDSRKVDDLRKALIATNLFSTVAVEPQKTGEDAGDGTQYVTLHVKQDAGPPRTIAGSLGFAAGEGITAQANWTHRNMFPPEGALIAHAIAGTRQQGAGVTFRRSNSGKRDRTLEIVAEAFHNDYDAYSAYTGRLAARIARDSTPIWQKRYTYAFGVEFLGTAETDYDAATGGRKRNTYYVAGVNGQVGFDTSDDLLNPTKGYRVTALVQPEATVRGGFDPYVRARIDASTYYPINDSIVLAGRVRFGTIQGAGLFDIAPSRRLYAGGGGSVRGYAYQALGEQAPDRNPVGGRSLNEGSFEARYRFGNYGVVAFVDAGQAYRETTPQFSNLRYGVGIGGRFYTNFGPMRLDIATPIGRKPGESRFNLYVSIGQAF
ncbi:membrane protein [Novosphingobium barchaimii LL02]|uniref:Membrane protein n=1 Tax=Novosphingobium barchaimii LL02 TaxID=1114963 RepID=A0A0J7Y749_9SPHN|nr:BamA/TamA family outer membrane protein [Novosphingobium barchaimii]KMS59482.1 membrane protein [Novosphingobium barchaimii LL02]